MKFFSFQEIREAGDCARFAVEVLGVQLKDGRCAAVWRGGDNPTAVSIEKDKWHDFRDNIGGGIIELCALAKFGGITAKNKQLAQEFLGEWLHLEPKKVSKPREIVGRYQHLIADGYKDVRHYDYTDEAGTVVHTTIRLEKEGAKKEFVQRTPTAENLKGVATYLYNLPAVLKADTVYLAEGEKDAETLMAWGLCGTTAPCGANKWEERYTAWLAGRNVVIVRDKDDAGYAHAVLVAKAVFDKAASVKIICPWEIAKDVTEWAEIEHGTVEKLRAAVEATPALASVADIRDDQATAILRAKELNREPFRNYNEIETMVNGRTKTERTARAVGEMTDEFFHRFLGFPCALGKFTLFDFDKDTDQIQLINSAKSLIAWASLKAKQVFDFARISGTISKEEFFEGIVLAARHYESIALAPVWPKRENVFYGFRVKCKPSKNHAVFEELLSQFCPATPEHGILLRSFFAAPLYFRPGIQRPCWLIDSNSGAGVGKTTLVELLALLYRCTPIRTYANQLKQDFAELKNGSILSATGRASRILLLDNVVGKLSSPELADLITQSTISGRPKFAPGEEVRLNDLTYCITANNAELSDDLASRSFTIMLSRPRGGKYWKRDVQDYIEKHRYTILGDIIDILNVGPQFNADPKTRVPEFEREVIMPMCGTLENYEACMSVMLAQRDGANADYEDARQVQETIRLNFAESGVPIPDNSVVFVRCEAYRDWLKDAGIRVSTADIRSYIRSGKMPNFMNDMFQFPSTHSRERWYGVPRATGVLWIGNNVNEANFQGVAVIGRTGKDTFGVVNSLSLTASREDEEILAEIRRRQIIEAEVIPPQPAPAVTQAEAVPAPAPVAALPPTSSHPTRTFDDFPILPYDPAESLV